MNTQERAQALATEVMCKWKREEGVSEVGPMRLAKLVVAYRELLVAEIIRADYAESERKLATDRVAVLEAALAECQEDRLQRVRALEVKVAELRKVLEGPFGGGGFLMTSGEVRCPECHHPTPKYVGHSDGCGIAAALARSQVQIRREEG